VELDDMVAEGTQLCLGAAQGKTAWITRARPWLCLLCVSLFATRARVSNLKATSRTTVTTSPCGASRATSRARPSPRAAKMRNLSASGRPSPSASRR
jgi:hypothetical protein